MLNYVGVNPIKKSNLTTHQLLGNFYPVECEMDICAAMDYAHWLGELGFHHGYIEKNFNGNHET